MRKRVITPEIGDKIAQMRESGLGQAFIAKRLGISKSGVNWYCLIQGIEPPKTPAVRPVPSQPAVYGRGNGQVRRFTQSEDSRLLELEREGLSTKEIAKRLTRPSNSVIGRLATLARRDARMGL